MNKMTLEEYEQLLQNHDWSYQYTEDARVYRAGDRNMDLIIKISGQSEEHQKLYQQYKTKNT